MKRSEEITASPDDCTLADEATRLLLLLACWLLLYGLGLFLTLTAGPTLFQAVGGLATVVCAAYCVVTGIKLYRINKTMRDINQ